MPDKKEMAPLRAGTKTGKVGAQTPPRESGVLLFSRLLAFFDRRGELQKTFAKHFHHLRGAHRRGGMQNRVDKSAVYFEKFSLIFCNARIGQKIIHRKPAERYYNRRIYYLYLPC